MFEHKNFDVYDFENMPLNRDLYMKDYEESFLAFFNGKEYKNITFTLIRIE